MRTTKSVTISLPPEQLKAAERLAKRQSRTMSELFREGLRRLQQEEESRPSPSDLSELRAVLRLIQADARQVGLNKMTKRQIKAEITAARQERRAKAKRPVSRPRT